MVLLPYTADGEYYSRRINLRNKQEREERLINARKYGSLGLKAGSVVPLGGSAVGAALGAIGGFILGDQETVFPVDMVAIPAYQAFMIQGTPAFQIYIKEGEVLTQVIPTDAMEATEALEAPTVDTPKRKPSKYNKVYSKAFESIKSTYKTKSGSWKKDGFKKAVAAAHKLAKKEMKK